MEVSSCENHLFLWAIYTMAMLDNQMVSDYIYIYIIIYTYIIYIYTL